MTFLHPQKDILDRLIDIPHMDAFLDYTDPFTVNRFYHRLKAKNCKDFIEKYSSADKSFLDAGAGRGPYTKIAQGKFKKIYCFEYDRQELEKAKKNLSPDERIIFEQVDITDIPLLDDCIDTAVCSEVLEHIPDNDKAMSEIYRVMKPGGMVLFSMPNNKSLLYGPSRFKNRKILVDLDQCTEKNARWEQLRHYTFSPKKIEGIATKAGFKIIKRQGAHIFRIPSCFRKVLMKDFPQLFKLYLNINIALEKYLPTFGSFYFLTLQK